MEGSCGVGGVAGVAASQSRPQMQNPTRVGGGGGSSPLHRVIPGCRRKRTSSRLWKGKQRSCGREWSNRRQKTTYVSEPGADLPLGSLCGAAPGSASPVELRGCLLVYQRAGGPQPGVHPVCSSWWAARVGCPSPVLLEALGPGKQGDALQQGQGNPCSWSLTPRCLSVPFPSTARLLLLSGGNLAASCQAYVLFRQLRAAFGACLHPALLCSKKARAFRHCLSNVLPWVAAGLEEKGVHVGSGVGDPRQKPWAARFPVASVSSKGSWVAFSTPRGSLPRVCGRGRTFVRRTGKRWKPWPRWRRRVRRSSLLLQKRR